MRQGSSGGETRSIGVAMLGGARDMGIGLAATSPTPALRRVRRLSTAASPMSEIIRRLGTLAQHEKILKPSAGIGVVVLYFLSRPQAAWPGYRFWQYRDRMESIITKSQRFLRHPSHVPTVEQSCGKRTVMSGLHLGVKSPLINVPRPHTPDPRAFSIASCATHHHGRETGSEG